jgi:uncharacterized cupredoxin-like copper-binding protein
MTTRPTARIRDRVGRRAIAAVAITASLWAAGAGLSGAAGASSKPKPTVVKASETDFHIALSKHSFGAGKYTFVAINKGAVTHSLEITGPGLSSPKTKDIQPGQSTKLTVTLKKGAYDVFCPVPGHKALGMNVNIKVGSGSGSGSSTSTTNSGGSGG